MTDDEKDAKIEELELEIKRLEYFKKEIFRQASYRRECVDDYVMGAKSAIDDYEWRIPRKKDKK